MNKSHEQWVVPFLWMSVSVAAWSLSAWETHVNGCESLSCGHGCHKYHKLGVFHAADDKICVEVEAGVFWDGAYVHAGVTAPGGNFNVKCADDA